MDNEIMKAKIEITEVEMKDLIVSLPGRPPAMLARDLAAIYNVTTGALNQAVKRNIDRFPEDFLFQTTDNETNALKSQSVISANLPASPYLFTQMGANQLSSVLQSDTAVQRSIQIMRAFTNLEIMTPAETLLHQAKMMVEQERKVLLIEQEQRNIIQKQKSQQAEIEEIKAKVTTTNSDYYTISGYATITGMRYLDVRKAGLLGKKAVKISKEYGIEMGSVKDERYGSVNTYHVDVLSEAFNQLQNKDKE